MVLVLDNIRIHHAQIVQKFLREERKYFHLISLLPYSPQLNPIERLCKFMEYKVIANVFRKDHNDIIQAITRTG
ncbi:transposase [Geobacillus sp. LEMMY01]|uniref:transposase n=1 Tax=Geobacillus sp. LEMMY01 TaxID=1954237 RepID=UPI0020CA4D17|nr:transposase [Geobacillus sp. LEMMY01]